MTKIEDLHARISDIKLRIPCGVDRVADDQFMDDFRGDLHDICMIAQAVLEDMAEGKRMVSVEPSEWQLEAIEQIATETYEEVSVWLEHFTTKAEIILSSSYKAAIKAAPQSNVERVLKGVVDEL